VRRWWQAGQKWRDLQVKARSYDYLGTLGRDAVMHVQSQYSWYFTLFGYRLAPV